MKLLEVYQHILMAVGLKVNEDGTVRKEMNRGEVPATIEIDNEHRQLVLPTYDNLKSEKAPEYVFFHPFQENISRGESRIISYIRKAYVQHYSFILLKLMMDVVNISAGKNVDHSKLTNEQREIISRIGKVDEKFVETFDKIVKANLRATGAKSKPIAINLRKGATVNGTKYSRVALLSSPLADEMISAINTGKGEKPTVFNVEVRKTDIPVLKHLLQMFFPDYSTDNPYVTTSNATDAPYCEVLVHAMGILPKVTNPIAEVLYGGKYPVYGKDEAEENFSESYLDMSWLTDDFKVENWRNEYLLVPMQQGNEGISSAERKNVAETVEKEESVQRTRPTVHQFGEMRAMPGNVSEIVKDAPEREVRVAPEEAIAKVTEKDAFSTFFPRASEPQRPDRYSSYRDSRDDYYNRRNYDDRGYREERRGSGYLSNMTGNGNNRSYTSNYSSNYTSNYNRMEYDRMGRIQSRGYGMGNNTMRNGSDAFKMD